MFRVFTKTQPPPEPPVQADSHAQAQSPSASLAELWAERELGEKDFVSSDEDMDELLQALSVLCPSKASSSDLSNALGSREESWCFTNILCRYLTRNLLSAGDNSLTKILCGDEGIVGKNCAIIITKVVLGQSGPDDLRPICTAGVPSTFIKSLVRLRSTAFLAESGRKREGEGFDMRKTQTALYWVLEVLRHVCQESCCTEDLVRFDAIRSLVSLSAAATFINSDVDLDTSDTVFELQFSKSIELHAADVLSRLIVQGSSKLLTEYFHQNRILAMLAEPMSRAIVQSDTKPFMFGFRIALRLLLQAGNAACKLSDVDFLEDVSNCNPLDILEAYILKLSRYLYSEGQSQGVDHYRDDVAEDDTAEARDASKSANQELRLAKIRRLRAQIPGRTTTAQLTQALEKASWDVERAIELVRDDSSLGALPAPQDGAAHPSQGAAAASDTSKDPPDAPAIVQEFLQRVHNTMQPDDAAWTLRRHNWDVEAAFRQSIRTQKLDTLADLLGMVKEFVFVGMQKIPAFIPDGDLTMEGVTSPSSQQAGAAGTTVAEDADKSQKGAGGTSMVEEMEKAQGRRVRDKTAFLLLCELWDRIPEDAFRMQVLDLALEIFGEHPLNFFSLQDARLLPKAMRALDFLSPQLRERTLKVLEYVVTVADCGVPLEELCLLNTCLDSLWGEDTVLIVLKTVSKWLTFDAKYSSILRETGLLNVLVDHCSRLCKNMSLSQNSNSMILFEWFENDREEVMRELLSHFIPVAKLGKAASAAGTTTSKHDSESASDKTWELWEPHSLQVSGGRVTKVSSTPQFSVALSGHQLHGKRATWVVTVFRRGRGWCGVGVATSDVELGESLRQASPAGATKQGKAWFYHDRGFLCNGEVICDDSVPPFEWRDGSCRITVDFDCALGEISFACNETRVASKITGVADKDIFPAVYCSDVDTWFELEMR
eukprot:CAMPEP_0113674852 /NCGR_PEP_ID=MMETSP0038_2-20120614/7674_1 /TAXON_ID=2898 /ORGANISM="Cryptomonas paramecium" /LENGTH=941 /DNA_ID=CAMNT_0000591529 /DNA_START=55 /DNA_END=2876 /DNA_ORIENTATION=- /assembly_acc=CAM_ASM_000170